MHSYRRLLSKFTPKDTIVKKGNEVMVRLPGSYVKKGDDVMVRLPESYYTFNLDKDKIGEGAFGAVYRADPFGEQTEKGKKHKPKAIKVFPQNADRKQIEQERQMMAKVSPSYLGECEGRFYLVMDYFEGHPLGDDSCRLHPTILSLPFLERINLIVQLLLSMSLVHQRRISGKAVIHLDIKLPNILFQVDKNNHVCNVVVVDFGLGEQIDNDEKKYEIANMKGNITYSPPELLELKVGVKSDIYSLTGVILLILGASNPFKLKIDSRTKALELRPSKPMEAQVSAEAALEYKKAWQAFESNVIRATLSPNFDFTGIFSGLDQDENFRANPRMREEITEFLQSMQAEYDKRPDTHQALEFFNKIRNELLKKRDELAMRKLIAQLTPQRYVIRSKQKDMTVVGIPEAKDKIKYYCFSSKNKMGAGKFGEVYRADPFTADGAQDEKSKPKAIKIFKDGLDIKVVEQESQMMNKISPTCWIQSQGQFFMLMDYFPGQVLAEDSDTEKNMGKASPMIASLSFLERINFIVQLLLNFALIHKTRINGDPVIHLDIKPSNIIFQLDEQNHVINVAIIDFGLGQQVDQEKCDIPKMKGNLVYSAPELLEKRVGTKSDIYSLTGIMLLILGAAHPLKFKLEKGIAAEIRPKSKLEDDKEYNLRVRKAMFESNFDFTGLFSGLQDDEDFNGDPGMQKEIPEFLQAMQASYDKRPDVDKSLSFFNDIRNKILRNRVAAKTDQESEHTPGIQSLRA